MEAGKGFEVDKGFARGVSRDGVGGFRVAWHLKLLFSTFLHFATSSAVNNKQIHTKATNRGIKPVRVLLINDADVTERLRA